MKISSSLETRELTELPKKWLEAYKNGLLLFIKEITSLLQDALMELSELFGNNNLYIGIERTNGDKAEHEEEIMRSFEAILYTNYCFSYESIHRKRRCICI